MDGKLASLLEKLEIQPVLFPKVSFFSLFGLLKIVETTVLLVSHI